MTTAAWEFKAPTMFDFKLAEDTAPGTFSGYLAVFGNLDSNEDIIEPGAFRQTLSEYKAANQMPLMWLNHGGIPFGAVTTTSLLPIGIWLEMVEDTKGLAVKGRIDPIDTEIGKQVHRGMVLGTVNGLSIGFTPTEFKRGNGKPGQPKRYISALKLFEGSVVYSPGNPLANVSQVKSSLDGILQMTREKLTGEVFDPRNVRHLDMLLREADLSRNEAKALLSKGFKGLSIPREAGTSNAFQGLLAEIQAAKVSA